MNDLLFQSAIPSLRPSTRAAVSGREFAWGAPQHVRHLLRTQASTQAEAENRQTCLQ
jgi:hypothetical protein